MNVSIGPYGFYVFLYEVMYILLCVMVAQMVDDCHFKLRKYWLSYSEDNLNKIYFTNILTCLSSKFILHIITYNKMLHKYSFSALAWHCALVFSVLRTGKQWLVGSQGAP